jgi:hypothetical protein
MRSGLLSGKWPSFRAHKFQFILSMQDKVVRTCNCGVIAPRLVLVSISRFNKKGGQTKDVLGKENVASFCHLQFKIKIIAKKLPVRYRSSARPFFLLLSWLFILLNRWSNNNKKR